MEHLYKSLVTILIFYVTATALPIKDTKIEVSKDIVNEANIIQDVVEISNIIDENSRQSENSRNIRPGIRVTNYDVEITPNINSRTFSGRLQARVELQDTSTFEDPIVFHAEDLSNFVVTFAIGNSNDFREIEAIDEDGLLIIDLGVPFTLFNIIIVYSGEIRNDGSGLYIGEYDDTSYLAMNLHPTHARRVFPCMDEPTEGTSISIKVNNAGYNNIIGNSINEGDASMAEFTSLQGPPHLWGLVAHDFVAVSVSGSERVRLFARAGTATQSSYAGVMTQNIFNYLNEWTDKPYTDINVNQEGNMNVFALPDITKDWYALSTVAIWEPYILMPNDHSIKQRMKALTTMASAYSKQWFGYVVYPENWRFSWVTLGLGQHAAYEAAVAADDSLDVNSVFLTDVIQEAMLLDSYSVASALEPENEIFEEDAIRSHLNGVLKYKAHVIFDMLKHVLGDQEDFIRNSARGLVNSRSLQTVNDLQLYTSINSEWFYNENKIIEDLTDFLEPWLHNTGYPVITIDLRSGSGLYLTQERFGFGSTPNLFFDIPLTYTTRNNPNFDNLYPEVVMGATSILDMHLGEEDWVIFNIQGRSYYRVKYHAVLWERIIMALDEEESREVIHPLNRAAILDDALNLARAGKEDYEIALQVAMTMNAEKEYAPWKTFVRNMNFLMKHLEAYVREHELEPNIYTRVVAATINRVQRDIGFYPENLIVEDPMTTLTRGLTMEHACRANFFGCVAAAYDWFYASDGDEPTVNPRIPPDMRPAIYCTMVREAGDRAIDALWRQYDEELSHYEKVVILQSFACSHDENFILSLLQETLQANGRFGVEERALFYEAVAGSHLDNTDLALRFIRANANAVQQSYGGNENLERVLYTLVNNLVTVELVETYETWVYAMNNNLDDSLEEAQRLLEIAKQNMEWNEIHLPNVYEWINENVPGHAPSMAVSLTLVLAAMLVNLFK